MSTTANSGASTTTTTKKTTIMTDSPKSKGPDKNTIIKGMRIALTLFYGQMIANAIYDNLIRGIPYLIDNVNAFPIIKVTLGVVIIALTIFAMIAIWMKLWALIFGRL